MVIAVPNVYKNSKSLGLNLSWTGTNNIISVMLIIHCIEISIVFAFTVNQLVDQVCPMSILPLITSTTFYDYLC
jgi:hypothetical protein